MKTYAVCLVLFLASCISMVRAAELPPPIEGRWQGKPLTLSEADQSDLRRQAIRLVESSNFHTGATSVFPSYKLPDAVFWVQKEYRDTVAGNYMVFNFPEPQRIKTLQDEIMVTQIVIGLNRDDFASSLFTVDEQGSVVGHGKYLGVYCIEFLHALKQDVQSQNGPMPSP